LPKRLFKYQRFDPHKSLEPGTPDEDYCVRNLRNREIRFTAPLAFNDPYDSASFFLTEKAFEHVPFNVEAFLALPEVRDHMSEELKGTLRASDRRSETIEKIFLQSFPDEPSRQIALQLREQRLVFSGSLSKFVTRTIRFGLARRTAVSQNLRKLTIWCCARM
jgi:hypothetical protein